MSTTFGVKIENDDYCKYCGRGYEMVDVAFRSNGIKWTNNVARLLDDSTKVHAIDNTQQGIYTIGDIRKQIIKEENS